MDTLRLRGVHYRAEIWRLAVESNYCSTRDIAAMTGYSQRQVRRRIARARAEPYEYLPGPVCCLLPRDAVPLARADCPDVHEDPIDRGSHDYCPLCHAYGLGDSTGLPLGGEPIPTEPHSRGRTVPARDLPGLKGGLG